MKEVILSIDGVNFKLKENHNFEWLQKYGKVDYVFDQNDSGNISFIVNQGNKKQFIKYAGAKTMNFEGEPDDAIKLLKKAAVVYSDIKHPILTNLIADIKTNDGYGLIFEYKAGECLHAHWNFDKYPKYTHPLSPNYRFNQLPLEKRIACVDNIFNFHLEVMRKKYVAIDFYDGCIIYDFDTHNLSICDIDYYTNSPYINDIGKMWGSSRFMSPEEYIKGSVIDEVTNVFTMGAVAFELLGSNRDRSLDSWKASKKLFEIAKKATSSERNQRYQTIEELSNEFKEVKSG